uniref:Uncharacterized protein n=1 Tax=Candidatus Methanogaster sp. ANME-2c ERB4 TaxID=2759911 RepID=A0A7G9YI59_9EURY|nr:hypothetical protein FJIOJMEM_00019 [Methanosarcinales archaeon ANME-2c ERB4]
MRAFALAEFGIRKISTMNLTIIFNDPVISSVVDIIAIISLIGVYVVYPNIYIGDLYSMYFSVVLREIF